MSIYKRILLHIWVWFTYKQQQMYSSMLGEWKAKLNNKRQHQENKSKCYMEDSSCQKRNIQVLKPIIPK